MTDSILGKIQEEFRELEIKQERERENFLASVPKRYNVMGGLLELLEDNNLRVHSQGKDEMMVAYERMTVHVNESGWACLSLNNGEILDFHDGRFKQLYAHLRQIYEERLGRETKPPIHPDDL